MFTEIHMLTSNSSIASFGKQFSPIGSSPLASSRRGIISKENMSHESIQFNSIQCNILFLKVARGVGLSLDQSTTCFGEKRRGLSEGSSAFSILIF
jgi:hypothetical protein